MAALPPSLESDEDVGAASSSDENEEGDEMDPSFEFGGILGEDGGAFSLSIFPVTTGWSFQSALNSINTGQSQSTAPPRMDIASIIAAKRKVLKEERQNKLDEVVEVEEDPEALGPGKEDSTSSSHSNSSSDDDDDVSDDENDKDAAHQMEKDVLKTRGEESEDVDADNNDNDSDEASSDQEDAEEARKAEKFYESQPSANGQETVEMFVQLTLSRPLLRGIAAMGFVKPTPIQAACIPAALSGRDICASAVTGSGKTAAFCLPILERLLHRTSGCSRALILTPTRELAAQCLGMLSSLAQFTNLRAALVVGGSKNLPTQAAELRTRPDIIVATPGRLLDHVTNSAGCELSDLEFLVMDEADRLLDLGFQDEVMEIVKACPVQRQTLLFSATMNTKVDDLIKLSLKRPVRIRVSDKNSSLQGTASSSGTNDVEVAPHLEQEFVRIRPGNEGINREAILLALLTRTFTTKTIVFFDTKVRAHRIMILCGLCGIKCAELHGNLTQPQRLSALESFRNGEVNVLLATDLAGRGIDIPNVETVVNFEMPAQVSTYIHRIGRTARAGRGGRACTLIGEGRRHLMKTVMKDAAEKKKQKSSSGSSRFQTGTIRSRSVPSAVVAHFVQKIQSLEPHVMEVMQAETVARLDRLADMEATKAENLIEHSGEIMARPQREWFASNKQKKMTKEALAERQAMIREKAGTGTHRMTRKKRRAREAKEALVAGDDGASDSERAPKDPEKVVKAAAKAAKRQEQKRKREVQASAKSLSSKVASEGNYTAPKTKKRKASSDAAGDSSLFEEDEVVHSTKSSKKDAEESKIKSAYKFRDDNVDPLGKKKGKKKSVHAFKSKSKYKRRK